MNYVIVCVRDIKSEVYGKPFYVRSLGEAARSFEDEINRKDEQNMMYNHPQDFQLFEMGVYDDNDGQFVFVSKVPRIVCEGVQVSSKLRGVEQELKKISKV